MSGPLEVLCFDVGNTLLDFHRGRTDEEKDEAGLRILTEHLRGRCPGLDLQRVREGFLRPWAETWSRREETLREVSVEPFLRNLLAPFGVEPGRAAWIEAMDAFHTPYREELAWEEGLPATLRALRGLGLRIGVVSNSTLFDEVMTRHLEHAGLADCLDACTFSYSLGIRKPRGEIFREALRRLGAPAERAAMVGDRLRADVWGAQQVGMRGVWLNRAGAPRDSSVVPDAEVRRLSEVGEAIAGWL